MTKLKIKNIILIGASVILPILAVVQDAFGGIQLGAWGSVGVIAAGFIAVLTNVANIWKPSDEDKALIKRIVAGIGVAASIGAPVLMSVYTSLPPATKGAAFIGALAGLASSLKEMLKNKTVDNVPVEQPEVIKKD